ncbi:DUF305 domain-containing protein [Streptomyces sp. NPDC055060]
MKQAPAFLAPAVLALCLLGGCSTPPDDPAAPTTAAAAPSLAGATATDTGWIQLLIPMDDQAARLLDLAAGRASAPEVAAWATGHAEETHAELARLRPLLRRMGLPGTNVHRGHDMPGMVTEKDIARSRRLTGAAFDRFVLRELRDHLGHSRRVSRSAARTAGNDEVRRLAARIADRRSGQLTSMP